MTTESVATACVILTSRFNFQTACACGACPIRANERRAHSFSRIARGLPRSRPQNEGHGAPRGAPCVRLASGIACEAMGFRKRIALRRSIAAILGEGTVLPGADGGGTRPLIRTAFAAFIRSASSRERRSHVVGPDGDPSLPDACLRDTRAGAASCSASKRPREAPLTNRTWRT